MHSLLLHFWTHEHLVKTVEKEACLHLHFRKADQLSSEFQKLVEMVGSHMDGQGKNDNTVDIQDNSLAVAYLCFAYDLHPGMKREDKDDCSNWDTVTSWQCSDRHHEDESDGMDEALVTVEQKEEDLVPTIHASCQIHSLEKVVQILCWAILLLRQT